MKLKKNWRFRENTFVSFFFILKPKNYTLKIYWLIFQIKFLKIAHQKHQQKNHTHPQIIHQTPHASQNQDLSSLDFKCSFYIFSTLKKTLSSSSISFTNTRNVICCAFYSSSENRK